MSVRHLKIFYYIIESFYSYMDAWGGGLGVVFVWTTLLLI